MCAPPCSRCRKLVSSAVSRSGLGMPPILARTRGSTLCSPTLNNLCNLCASGTPHPRPEATMDLHDPQTYERVYDDHGRGVYAAAFRILGNAAQAQDVTQDVFLKLWRNPNKFDARRGELGSYLRLMARSRALDLWREGQAAGRASDRLKMVTPEDDGRPEERPDARVEREEGRGAVREALRRLPSTQREALVLAYWGGLTADQIAQRSRVPLGTAKSRIRLGLARLRDECGEELGVTATAA